MIYYIVWSPLYLRMGVQDWREHWSFQHGNAYIPNIIHVVHWEHKEM